MTENSPPLTASLELNQAPLGKKSTYISTYTPSLLFPVPRKLKREEICITSELPFKGFDVWNGYELSWLNPKGKPIVAFAEFWIPCESPHLIESKSFKLYLNSFNSSKFESLEKVKELLESDLSKCAGAPVFSRIYELGRAPRQIGDLRGTCLDNLDIECSLYHPERSYLSSSSNPGREIEETVHSHLLKSNCLVTGQPDWGSVEITYRGREINHEGLLKYIVSFRDHNEFHEQCVERIFSDILTICRPQSLTVYARYTRRGGLDINPFRTNDPKYLPKNPWEIPNQRLVRQ